MTDQTTPQPTKEEVNILADLYTRVGKDKTLTTLEKRRFRKRIWKMIKGEYLW